MAIVDFILVLHALATCLMAGLCWCVQVVHYPLMGRVPGEGLRQYAAEHARRITWFVAPVMFVEAATSGLLLVVAAAGHNPGSEWAWARGDWRIFAGVAMLAIIWGSTFGVLVPLHGRLQRVANADEAREIVAKLVAHNWVRTILWSARAVLALLLLKGGGM